MVHTPGPWQFYELPNHQGSDGLGYIRTVPEDGLEIAHHGDIGRSWSENVANAHLIAAAPDLLESLRALLEAIGGEESTDVWCVDARAAIAKAETV